jgi:SAM-dependent methyltransferase
MAPQVPRGRIYGIDLSALMTERATARNHGAILSGRVSLRLGDFETLPFAEGSMDCVLAVNVAYSWTRGEFMVSDIRRVLRRRGRCMSLTEVPCTGGALPATARIALLAGSNSGRPSNFAWQSCYL